MSIRGTSLQSKSDLLETPNKVKTTKKRLTHSNKSERSREKVTQGTPMKVTK